MKRPTFLSSHLRSLNRGMKVERRRFFRLYPLACLSLACGFAYAWRAEQTARLEVEALLSDERITYVLKDPVGRAVPQPPLSLPSQASKTRSTTQETQGTTTPGDSVHLLWRSETDSGVKVDEQNGLSFTF